MTDNNNDGVFIEPNTVINEKTEIPYSYYPGQPYYTDPDLLQEYFSLTNSKNTKEEYEILNGLFMGNYMFEERKGLKDVKLSKIIDLL